MPGVLILEALAQISGILGFVTHDTKPGRGSIHYFAGSNRVRFKRPVVPGITQHWLQRSLQIKGVSGSLIVRLQWAERSCA